MWPQAPPPKKAFGLWVSTFGYHNWGEIDCRLSGLNCGLTGLKSAGFPLDGFVLDLYWYGGISKNDTKIGTLTWDETATAFPKPRDKLVHYRDDDGVGIILMRNRLSGRIYRAGQT
jgi:alpha-glucosidase